MIIKENLKTIFGNTLRSMDNRATGVALPIRDINGLRHYMSSKVFAFPASPTLSYTASPTAAGISLGTDDTPPSQDDFNLGNTITSGLSVVVQQITSSQENGNPFIKILLAVTNTSGDSVTINEIGYKQTIKGGGFDTEEANNYVCLLDRSVLADSLIIADTDVAIIEYKLFAIPYPERYKNGIKLVSFEYGTDEEIVACIDGAHNNLIDLQEDCGWKLGDTRKIHISEFIGYNNITTSEQDCYIIITSFDNYNNCGNVVQFDFATRINLSGQMTVGFSDVGGYSASEMYLTTLPNLVNALPSYLKNKLITFDVTADNGAGASAEITVVSNNKLALRSITELVGESTDFYTEGTQIIYFSRGDMYKNRGGGYWTRTCSKTNVNYWIIINSRANVAQTYGSSQSESYGQPIAILPFGCL